MWSNSLASSEVTAGLAWDCAFASGNMTCSDLVWRGCVVTLQSHSAAAKPANFSALPLQNAGLIQGLK